MKTTKLQDYKKIIKMERNKFFDAPFDLAYKNFVNLGYDKKTRRFFKENASEIVENLRSSCWKDFLNTEKKFNIKMFNVLINQKYANSLFPNEAITNFLNEYSDYIYELILSNTQSRRSRAGKEFESIIELLLMGAEIKFESQGILTIDRFTKKEMGKMIDLVLPGVIEFNIDKTNIIIISAKTTLRERWQEVVEEMSRTGAKEIILATLDEKINEKLFTFLSEKNIKIATTKKIKEDKYKNNSIVLTFEDLIKRGLRNMEKWKNYKFNSDKKELIKNLYIKQIEKHRDHKFVVDFYKDKLNE
ncbi:type II restriction endonuclease [Mycoplasmopsis citelli]|uniref:type II restriction endonuclease n=1 Tax=Mycoplasmopsis citelli TaxID=171281 RepID=UPI001CB7A16A|nr:type II restriction endonuclease [Mycoplasmopsis citelli]